VIGAIAADGAVSVGPGFVTASHAGFWIAAGCGLLILVLALASTTGWAAASARRVVEQIG
jgi:hypothetical protein